MRAKIRTGFERRKKVVLITVAAVLAATAQVSTSDNLPAPDSCELEARQAYAQALKLCQLAQEPNPRLRCYEAARAVYLHTLEECRNGSAR